VTIPEAVREGVEGALEARGAPGPRIVGASPVGGGCISPAARAETAGGEVFFLKWGTEHLPSGLLACEVRGLRALSATGALRVPEVVASGGDGGSEWLALEWLEPGAATAETWERLGRGLADLHRHRGDRFGDPAHNYIGSLPQANTPSSDWPAFWAERRLEPQLRAAVDAGLLDRSDRARFHELLGRLDHILGVAHDDGPSLLHGDLWSGNVHVLEGGSPSLIDPSTYHGHREVDLAMAQLFGGFGRGFRLAYEDAWPLAHGYEPARRATYQLYYLLVHVNLFGAGYVEGTRRALAEAGA
jgi:protein-ribulosamine 3-kinase